jgi:hypothetical protein
MVAKKISGTSCFKKMMIFSPQIGEQSRVLRCGALTSAGQSTVEIKIEQNE